MQANQRSPWSKLSACLTVTAILYFTGPGIYPAAAADAANEARAINKQVNTLVESSNFSEAETLAKRGLQLCDDAGDIKVFCASQFNESLGDIAFGQAQYPLALAYLEQALHLREAGLESGNPLISRSLQRVGRAYLALHRTADAEAIFERAVSGFEKLVPVNRELGVTLGYLRKIYLDTDRVDKAAVVARRELEVYQAIGNKEEKAISNAKLGLNLALSRQVGILFKKNDYSAAEPILIEAISLIDPPPPGWERSFSTLQSQLGSVYERQQRYMEAEPFMLRALEYSSKIAGPPDANVPIVLSNLAALYGSLNRPSDAIRYGVRAVSWFDENKKETSTLGFALFQIGRAEEKLGHFSDAEAALLRAKEVFDRFLPKGDPQLINVRIDLGTVWTDQERFDEAEQIYKSALELEPQLIGPTTGWRSALLASLGRTYLEQARYADAEPLLREAVKLEEAAGQERTKFLGPRLAELAAILRRENRYAEAEAALLRVLALKPPELDRAAALNSLGVLYSDVEQHEKAETVLKEALEIRTKALPANDFSTAETLGNLAVVDNSRGRYADAEIKFRQVLEIVDGSGQSRSSKAALYSAFLSQTLAWEGRLDEADALIRRSLDLYQQRVGIEHPRFAGALGTRASIEALRGQDREAEDHYRQALAIDEKAIGPQSPTVAGDMMRLVPLLKRAGKRPEARAIIEHALAINVGQFGAESPMTVGPILASANMAYEAGQYADARQLAERARQIQEHWFGPDRYATLGSWIFAARLDIAEGKLDHARESMDRAARIIAKALPPDHPSNIDVLEAEANLTRALGELAETEHHDRDALAIAERLLEPDHPTRRGAVDRLTGALWAQGKFTDAERLQRDELGNVEVKRGPDHPSTAIAIRGVAGILGRSARLGEAVSLFHRALAIDERAFGPQSERAAWDHLAIGSLLRRMGQFEDARTEINLARNAWESQGRLLAADSSLEELAVLAFEQGSPAEGIVFLERVVQVTEQAFGPDSPALAAILAQLGRFYAVAGRNDAAERILARITGLIGDNPPEQTPGYLDVLQLRAQLDAERGNFDDAEARFARAIAIAVKYGGLQSNAVGNYSFNLAVVYLKAGRYQDAINYFIKALDIFKRENGDHAAVAGYALLGAARAYDKIGDAASARALSAAAIEILGPTIAAQRLQPQWL